MVATLDVYRGIMVVSGILLLAVALWIDQRREGRAVRPFVWLVAALGLVATIDGAAAGDIVTLSIVWLAALVSIPLAFTLFVVEYYGLPQLATRTRKGVFVLPAVVGIVGGSALILAPEASGTMSGGASAPPSETILGIAVVAEQIGIYYAGGVMLVGLGLLARTVSSYEHLDARLATVFSAVAIWPWLAYFITPSVFGRLTLESIFGLTTGGYVLSAGAVIVTATRGGLFEAAPAAGTLSPSTVLSELDDSVIVVDQEGRIVKVNRAARETFNLDPEAVTGEPFGDCLDVNIERLRDPSPFELTVPGGTRHFEADVSPVQDRLGRQPGEAIVISDVTRERVRSQRLSVLNRVLRHNLRNGMNNIMGRAELIADSETEYRESAEEILTSAGDLVKISERAREVEEIMSTAPALDEEVRLAALAEEVLDEYRREYPEAALSVDIAESVTLTVDRGILSRVLENLIENALKHNDAPTPVVTVSARRPDGDDVVRISVADNGPGIPEQERAVIDSGAESPLEHGSGLGLWAVKWGALRLGGEITFRDNQPEGSVVSLRLPDISPQEPPSDIGIQAG